MTIPDDTSELPHWLEGRLMAPDFRRFVAELLALFPTTPGVSPPRQLFDQWLPKALAEGLDQIPMEVLNQLIKHPVALAMFQERIVTDGGAYWDEVLDRSDDLSAVFERGKKSIERIISADAPPLKGKAIAKATPKTTSKAKSKAVPSEVVKSTGGRGYKIWAFVSTGVAACLAMAVGYYSIQQLGEQPIPKSQIAWGWGKPSGLAAGGSNAKDYLNKLADNAEEWWQHQPGDAVGVGTRIAEFRIGCTRLMHSTYGPLKAEDKAWLLEHCREWAKKLDAHQQTLDTGADPKTVRADVDETVRGIATTLREKAKQLG
jgi:hypothetical protein